MLENMHKFRLFIIACVVLTGAFFRFYAIHDWLIFGMDQEYQTLISESVTSGRNVPLIGVNASDTGLYLGPWFSYGAAAIHWASAGNPLGGAIASSLTGLAVVVLIYILGTWLLGRRTALIAALIYSSSFLVSFYERQFWNPTPVPLVSLLLGFLLTRLFEGKIKLLPWLFLLLGLSFSIHLSLLIFFPLSGYIIWHVRKKISLRQIGLSLSFFVIAIAPQMVFEISHGFLQTRALLSLIVGKQDLSTVEPIANGVSLLWNMLGRFVWLPGHIDWFTLSGQCRELASAPASFFPGSIVMGFACTAFFFLKKSPLMIRYLLAASAVFALLYPRQIFEYYFLFLFPWLALVGGAHLDWLSQRKGWGKITVSVAVIFFIFANIASVLRSSYSYPYRDKMNALAFAKEIVRSREYGLEAFGECPRFGGWRYLSEWYMGYPPVHSYMDSYFSWLYQQRELESAPEVTVVLSMIDDRMDQKSALDWKEKERQYLLPFTTVAQSEFGKIRVYIVEK